MAVPSEVLRHAERRVQMVLVVEMSTGQMVEDVRLAMDRGVDVEFYGRIRRQIAARLAVHAREDELTHAS